MENYATGNTKLIETLSLAPHPEGGYFVETDRQEEVVPSPFAHGKERSLGTSIYYLLTPERPMGYFHMNKSVTYHVLHQGRAEYTLIRPPPTLPLTTPSLHSDPVASSDSVQVPSPRIETVIMGTNADAGEVRMLLVGTGVWKRSNLLPEDLELAKQSPELSDKTGCLITEVVVPGFDWEDHKYLTKNGLEKLFAGVDGGNKFVSTFEEYVLADS
ncbi:hypothetical protein SCHPADRAFT_944236 [Schizopora paradoxa]|uniref:DUF985 domain-containing protein n=1 Tax=Schizopora paradoxa TaxID=27342 RepID=A0A0H2RV50_9AGAM|nr:hypothetical protein SCHPADRAFT_944236 [Schizopora paradoxa]